MNRRQLFLATGASGLGLISTVCGKENPKKALRVGHVTDIHITKDREAPQGVAALFAHMMSQKDGAPELVINSGDAVMAIDGKTSGAKAQEQIDVWKAALKAVKVPVYSCLGNHDIWNGDEPTAAIPATKKTFSLMTEVLGMPAPYYSFDKAGWHFIALNSMCNWPNYGELTPEHFQWLKDDLKKTPKDMPVCVFSHLPIVSVTSSLYGNAQKRADGVIIPKVWQHRDCWEISEVFRKHPNVKVCLSGHMHTQDRCEYRGVWYICGGAGSGAWWGGSEYGFPPCYGIVDLFESGAFEYRFVDYGWKARDWKGQELKG